MDISAPVAAAINAWLDALATQMFAPALAAVGDLLFRTPSFAALPAVARTWGLIRAIADAIFVLAWLGTGLLVMTHGGTEARYTAKVLVPRVVLAAVLVNASLALCGALIALNNALVDALLAPSPAAVVGSAFGGLVRPQQLGTDLLAVILALAAAALALLLVALSIGRAFVLLLATALAPIALASYALPQTDELARLWFRVFCGLLFVQVLQAALVRVASEVVATADWLGGPVPTVVSGLVTITLLYALLRLPFVAHAWAFRAPFSHSPVVRVVSLGARALRGAA